MQPGSEPGIDTSKSNDENTLLRKPSAECQITVVNCSEANIEIHELDNSGLIKFMKAPQPQWVKCRWVNVNGFSWDVIQVLGESKQLHGLAIEDLLNTQNRTRADW
jgi:hypothetical protein